MVRLHAQIAPQGPGSGITDVNEKEIDGIWRFVAAAKKQGIYVTISPYWAGNRQGRRAVGDRGVRRPRRTLGPALLRRDPPARLQGVGHRPLLAGQPLHRHPPGEGPGRRDHPGPERGQPLLLDHHGDQARPAGPAGREVRRVAGQEVRLARRPPQGLGGAGTRRRHRRRPGRPGRHLPDDHPPVRRDGPPGGRRGRLLRGHPGTVLRGDHRLLSRRPRLPAADQRLELEDRQPGPARRHRALDLYRRAT